MADRASEFKYVAEQIRAGRPVVELHELIDAAARSVIDEMRGERVSLRLATAKNEIYESLLAEVVEHLKPMGEFGGTDELLTKIAAAAPTDGGPGEDA